MSFFTVYLSKVSFCVYFFCFLLFGVFFLLLWICVLSSETDCYVLCCSFDVLVFQVALIWLSSGLGTMRISHTCCWFCGISKLRWLV